MDAAPSKQGGHHVEHCWLALSWVSWLTVRLSSRSGEVARALLPSEPIHSQEGRAPRARRQQNGSPGPSPECNNSVTAGHLQPAQPHRACTWFSAALFYTGGTWGLAGAAVDHGGLQRCLLPPLTLMVFKTWY